MRAAIFLDRDGVINVDRYYVSRIEDFQFIDGAIHALRTLGQAGFPLVIVTNQSAIGRGLYSLDDFQTLNRWMLAVLADHGVAITDVYYCPHAPEANCDCRKPAPGMLLRAAEEHQLNLEHSWMIGDKPTDIEAGVRAGVPHTIQVLSGQAVKASESKAVFVCPSISDTVPIIFRVAMGAPA